MIAGAALPDVTTEDRYLVGEAQLQVELTSLDLQRPAAPSLTPTTGLIPRRRLRMCRMRSSRHCSCSGHNDSDEMRDAPVPRDRGRRTRTPPRPSPRPGAGNPWPAGSSASARMSRTCAGDLLPSTALRALLAWPVADAGTPRRRRSGGDGREVGPDDHRQPLIEVEDPSRLCVPGAGCPDGQRRRRKTLLGQVRGARPGWVDRPSMRGRDLWAAVSCRGWPVRGVGEDAFTG